MTFVDALAFALAALVFGMVIGAMLAHLYERRGRRFKSTKCKVCGRRMSWVKIKPRLCGPCTYDAHWKKPEGG